MLHLKNARLGSPAKGNSVVGIVDLFVYDLFGTGGTEMEQHVLARLRISKMVQKTGMVCSSHEGTSIRN